ncbi:MAG: hypothetical protein ACJA04_000430 [Cellvibrionaceae bacterium]|jgi:hypothetical protein
MIWWERSSTCVFAGHLKLDRTDAFADSGIRLTGFSCEVYCEQQILLLLQACKDRIIFDH